MTAAEFLSEIVCKPSPSKGEHDVADFIETQVRSWGFAPQRLGNNVWFEIGTTGPRLLLNSHIDTVSVCDGWTGDPYCGEWRDGRLTALGSNDAGGCVVSLLHAAKQFSASYGRVVVAITAEEETGGADGIAAWLEHFGEPIHAAIVGEPTSLQVVNAQRGMLLMRCVAEGVSGHVAHSHVGVNAIHKAARDIVKLDAMRFEPHPVLGETRAQVTVIEGGLLKNQIPDRCEFFVDLRTTPNLDHEELSERFKRELETEVIIHSERYQPKDTPADHPIVQAALKASPCKEPVGSATVSDWAFLGDIPAVKVGPGNTLRSHTPNEYLLLEELEAGIQFYSRCLDAYFELAKQS